MTRNELGLRKGELILLWHEKRAHSHVYMCQTGYDGNYDNPLMHTLDHQPHISLKILAIIEGIVNCLLFGLWLTIKFCRQE
jgi:hypothetical protein